jgi:plastocyanin
VPLGTDLRFTNIEGGGVLHTITACGFPCLGPTGAAFPIADGESSAGRQVEMDSGQLGYAAPEISGAKNTAQWELPVTAEQGYQPGEIVTYFCRIHPSMRGAFEVTE